MKILGILVELFISGMFFSYGHWIIGSFLLIDALNRPYKDIDWTLEENYYMNRIDKVYIGALPCSKEVPCPMYPHMLPWTREQAGRLVLQDADLAY